MIEKLYLGTSIDANEQITIRAESSNIGAGALTRISAGRDIAP